jgi:hypothetical protein
LLDVLLRVELFELVQALLAVQIVVMLLVLQ